MKTTVLLIVECSCFIYLVGVTIFMCSEIKTFCYRSETRAIEEQENVTINIERNRDNSSCINVSSEDQVYVDYCNHDRQHALHVRNNNGTFQHALSLSHRQFNILEGIVQRLKTLKVR